MTIQAFEDDYVSTIELDTGLTVLKSWDQFMILTVDQAHA